MRLLTFFACLILTCSAVAQEKGIPSLNQFVGSTRKPKVHVVSKDHEDIQEMRYINVDRLKKIRKEGVFLVGMDNFPPFEFSIEENVFSGESVELLRKVAERSQIPVKFYLAPWPRLLVAVRKGIIDAALSVTNDDVYQKDFYIVPTPMAHYQKVIVSLKRKNLPIIEKENDLINASIGGLDANVLGFSYNVENTMRVSRFAYIDLLVMGLVREVVDYIVITDRAFEFIVKNLKLDPNDFYIHPYIPVKGTFHLGIAKKSPRAGHYFKLFSEAFKTPIEVK